MAAARRRAISAVCSFSCRPTLVSRRRRPVTCKRGISSGAPGGGGFAPADILLTHAEFQDEIGHHTCQRILILVTIRQSFVAHRQCNVVYPIRWRHTWCWDIKLKHRRNVSINDSHMNFWFSGFMGYSGYSFDFLSSRSSLKREVNVTQPRDLGLFHVFIALINGIILSKESR